MFALMQRVLSRQNFPSVRGPYRVVRIVPLSDGNRIASSVRLPMSSEFKKWSWRRKQHICWNVSTRL